ncbi:MAG: hypothetical protein ACLP1Y_07655 [Candidatus Acidiferrales bacterium]
MTSTTDIPRGDSDSPGPCWIPRESALDGKKFKPAIKCKCGQVCFIGLHHVHTDGTITRSFFHSEATSFTEGGKVYHHEPGCGWHVWLRLLDYDEGDFPPEP